MKKTKVVNAVSSNEKLDVDKMSESKNKITPIIRAGIEHVSKPLTVKEPELHKYSYCVQMGIPVWGSVEASNRNEAMERLRIEIGHFAELDISMSG